MGCASARNADFDITSARPIRRGRPNMSRKSTRNRRRPPEGTAGARRATSLRVVVAAYPRSEVSVLPELPLVKAGLLYGDSVTLLSPVTTMLLRTEALPDFSLPQQIRLFRRLAPYLLDADARRDFEGAGELLDRVISPGASPQELRLRGALIEHLRPSQMELAATIRGMARDAGMDHLARGRAEGLIKVESVDPGNAVDLIADCVIAAKCAESGERPDDAFSGRVIDTFVGKLASHLSSGREYLIFDEQVASLTHMAVEEGLFKPATGPAGRSAQAMAASGFVGRLPTFPNATVDEVLDIRAELADPLTRFRGAIVTVANGMTSEAWDGGFGDEIHDAWIERIEPAIAEIHEWVRERRSLLAMATGIAGAANTSAPGLAVVAAGVAGHADAVAVLGGMTAASAPVLQALRDRRAAASQLRMQPFYLLHAAEQALSRG